VAVLFLSLSRAQDYNLTTLSCALGIFMIYTTARSTYLVGIKRVPAVLRWTFLACVALLVLSAEVCIVLYSQTSACRGCALFAGCTYPCLSGAGRGAARAVVVRTPFLVSLAIVETTILVALTMAAHSLVRVRRAARLPRGLPSPTLSSRVAAALHRAASGRHQLRQGASPRRAPRCGRPRGSRGCAPAQRGRHP
jgi:hypothetical protein